MPTLKEKVLSKYVKALGFGRSKVGKTFGAGTFPRPNFIDCDAGVDTLLSEQFLKLHGFKPDLKYEQFKERGLNERGIPRTANAFDDVCRYFDSQVKPGVRDTWDTLVVDTGTSLSQFAMNKAIVLLGGSGFKGAASNTQKEALDHGLLVPKLQDYGSERSMVEQFIAMIYDLDKHVLFLCHEKEISDDDGVLQAVVPLLTGKGVEAISAMFDEVWNIRAKPVGTLLKRYIQTEPSGKRMCGSRSGIANETEWNFAAISKEVERIRQLRADAGKLTIVK